MRRGLLLVMLASAAVATTIEDFEQSPQWQVYKGAERGGSFTVVAAPEPHGLSGQLAWSVPHHPFLELFRSRPLPLTVFDSGFHGSLTVWVQTAQPAAVRGVSLRLVDAAGETFQFTQPDRLTTTGWQRLTYQLEPGAAAGHWGGDGNGVLDLPVRLSGFAVSFTDEATEPGAIVFDDIAVHTPGQPVETRRPLWRFGADERWNVHGSFQDVARFVDTPEGLVLEIDPVEKDAGMPTYERRFRLKSIGTPEAVSLRAELLAGGGVDVHLRLRDGRGEVHAFPARALQPGLNELTWRIPDERNDFSWGENVDKVMDPPYWLHELYFRQRPSTTPTRIRLLSGDQHGRQPLLETVELEAETGHPIRILEPGHEQDLRLKLSTAATQEVRLDLRVELEDYAGRRLSAEQQVTVPARGEVTVEPGVWPDSQGIWWVNYTLTAAGGQRQGRTSCCVMEPAGPTPGRAEGFLFSICTHTERWPRADQELEVLAAALCGAKVIRTGPGWGTLEREEGQWNFEPLDRLVDMYGQKGMELQYLLAFCPRWAAPPEWRDAPDWLDWSRHMPRLDAWATYCRTVATRYRDRIRYWEVWNEPDIGFWRGTLDEYLLLLQTAYETIKAVDPELQVMNGGFAIYDRNPAFIEAVIDRGQAWFDILAYHRHGDFDPFRREVDGPVAALRAKLDPPRPIYYNETALSSVAGGERVQAEALFKKLTFAWSRGAMGYTWYDLRNDGWDPKDWEHNYGMVTNDFHPKAVYPTFNTLVRLLGRHEYDRELALGSDRYGFVFRREGEQVITTWSETAAGPARHFLLQTDAVSAETVDLMGNRAPLPVLPGGRVVLANGAPPSYLVLTGASEPVRLLGPLVDLGGPYTAIPGETVPVTVRFANPLDQTATVQLDWLVPAGWQVGDAAIALPVEAGGVATATTTLLVPPAAASRSISRHQVALRYELPGTALRGEVAMPVELAVALGDRAPTRSADFVLDQQSQAVTLYGNDPGKAHLVWRGAEDLSAAVWLTPGPAALGLRVEVRDDTHAQPHQDSETWRGDSVQFGLQVPGHDGHWEFALARLADGRSQVWRHAAPAGRDDPTAVLRLVTTPTADGLRYELDLPLDRLGLTPETLRHGIRFNLLVNDDDGEGREGWIELAPGIGRSKDPSQYPLVVFR